jgi:hypothetical protein
MGHCHRIAKTGLEPSDERLRHQLGGFGGFVCRVCVVCSLSYKLAMARCRDVQLPIKFEAAKWVGEDEVGRFALHQGVDRGPLARVTAEQPVPAENPHIFALGHGRHTRSKRWDDGLRLGSSRKPGPWSIVEHERDFIEGETGQLHLEIEVDQTLQFDRQQFSVPPRRLRELVVGKHVGPPLGRPEVRKPYGWHAEVSEKLCSLDPTVPGNDLIVVADQDWVGEAEPFDAAGDLPDLPL